MNTSNWKAGVAGVAITPTEPMWLAGWAARREPAAGKSTELFAKALAVEDGQGQTALIITADLIAIPRELAQQVATQLQTRCGIPRSRILLHLMGISTTYRPMPSGRQTAGWIRWTYYWCREAVAIPTHVIMLLIFKALRKV